MAMQFYNGSLIISAPRRAPSTQNWIPYAFVSWLERGQYQFHRFPELRALTFTTEREALFVGFSVARSWTAPSA